MRIGIQTWGSFGDIRPFIALAERLHASGHVVTLVTTSIFNSDKYPIVSTAGVNYVQVASPVAKNMEEVEKLVFQEKNPIKQAKNMLATMFLPAEEEMFKASEQLCRDNDLVVGHFFLYTLQTAAEISDTPYVSIMTAHNTLPTLNRPPAGLPAFGRFGNKLFWGLIKKILNKSIKPHVDNLRLKHGLTKAKDLINDVWCSRELNLIAVSPQLCERENDWSENIQICGFLNTKNNTEDVKISDELALFLKIGTAPFYISFGGANSPSLQSQKETITLLCEAIALTNARAIIQMPRWESCSVESSQNIFYLDHAEHALIFPHCQAIIHHGGAGTTQSAMLAAVPSIVVSHNPEQEFWGLKLHQLGIAPKLLKRKSLNAQDLAKAILTVNNDSAMGNKAQKIGKAMQLEKGVELAVNFINQKFVE